MKKNSLLLASAISLESLLGCGPTEFPQYSGIYKLQSFSYSDPSFVGEKQIPPTLIVVDRMEHIGSYWDHSLLLEFIQKTEDQARGTLALELDDLTRIDHGTLPNDSYNGVEIHQEREVHGTSAFCNYQYLYFLYLETVPNAEMLQNVYPGRGRYIGDDPSTKMPLYESLSHPEEVDFNSTEWLDAVEDNEGITLNFTFARHLKSEMPSWENGYQDCILPSDSRGSESLAFTYHADLENLNDETDIRKEGIEKIRSDLPGIVFFRGIVSGVKY